MLVFRAFSLEPCPDALVFDNRRRLRIVDSVEATRGESVLRKRALPSGKNLLWIVLTGGDINLIEDGQKFGCIRSFKPL